MHIAVNGLNYSYPDGHKALHDISLNVSRGEKVALVGSNGAGKSTLLLHLNGILRGDGNITIEGVELRDDTINAIRKKVGIIFQDPNDQLFCPTVRDDVAFGPEHFGLDASSVDEIVARSLSHVAMGHAANRAAHHLSLGERKRVSIAAVLACAPEILIFDEPAAMLDPRRKREMISFIKGSNRTVIIATHDPDFAVQTTSRCVIMDRGRIVAEGDSKSILNDSELLSSHGL